MTDVTDDALLRQIEAAEATIAVADKNIKIAKAALLDRRQKEITELLKAKPEPFGDVTIVVGNHQIKVNVPKKVTWDGKILAKKYAEIKESGDAPDVYIQTEYKISETAYKTWPKDVQDFFVEARTIEPGNISMKIMKEK